MRGLSLLVTSPQRAPVERTAEPPVYSLELLEFEPGASAAAPVRAPHVSARDETAFLLDSGDEQALLVSGANVRHLPRGEGEQDLVCRAAAGAAVWRRQRERLRARLNLPDRLIAYVQQLGRDRCVAETAATLAEHATRIVGAYGALVLLPDGEGGGLQTLGSFPEAAFPHLSMGTQDAFSRQGLIRSEHAQPGTGGPFNDLEALFCAHGAAAIAHSPTGDGGVLFLVERRADRDFAPEDWELLRVLASQADTAWESHRLLAEVRALALTDPLTGLPNRRSLAAFLEHAWAAAGRGQPLAVVMLDLERFKQINDERGHLAGDRILQSVAECLQELTRGSDLVVRYGGDEFLLVLPGVAISGARRLVERVRARLGGEIAFTAGIAEYQSGMGSPEQLIEAADGDLYAIRQRRTGAEA